MHRHTHIERDTWLDWRLALAPELRPTKGVDVFNLVLMIVLFTAPALFAVQFIGLPPKPLILVLLVAVGTLLLWLTWVDLRLQRLPNVLVGALLLLGLGLCFSPLGAFPKNAVLGFLLGGGLFALLAWGFWKLTGRPGMGEGDVKLMAVLGLLVGATGLPLLLLLGSWSALPVALTLRLRGQAGKRIPFGPFLCLAAWVVFLYQPVLWPILANLSGH